MWSSGIYASRILDYRIRLTNFGTDVFGVEACRLFIIGTWQYKRSSILRRQIDIVIIFSLCMIMLRASYGKK